MTLVGEVLMRSVAKGSVATVLTATKVGRAIFVRFVFYRCKGTALMAAIAKRLLPALATRAPIVSHAG
jgi:hypothetical protein